MKRRLTSHHLKEVVGMTWISITLETVSKLYESMPERVQRVIKKRSHNQILFQLISKKLVCRAFCSHSVVLGVSLAV